MKRTYRLTALILVLLMLVNLSASATSTGISLDELNIDSYETMVAEASGDEASQEGNPLSYPCEEKPEYCQFSVYSQMTATGIYDYFNKIYADENGDISELYAAMMLHYGEYHLESNLICTCGVHPLPLPDYQIGDISVHDEDCPWHFANLTVPEQYSVVMMLSAEKQDEYMGTLTADQTAALEEYINAQSAADACDGEGCGYKLIKSMTGAERHAQFGVWIETEADLGNMYNVFINHVYEKHPDASELCLCDNYQANYAQLYYGSFSHVNGKDANYQPVDCPWHFSQLSTEEKQAVFAALTTKERAQMKTQMADDDWNTCTLALSQQQVLELEAYLALQNSTDPADQEKLDRVNKTEYSVTSNGDSETDPSTTVAIKVPQGAFDVDYIMNAAASALNDAQQAALQAMHQLAVFDISFAELANEANKLQPNSGYPVELSFTVDTSKIIGSNLHVHHLKDNGDGTYTAESLGSFALDKSQQMQTVTVECPAFSSVSFSADCDGSACGYQTLLSQTAQVRYNTLVGWVNTAVDSAYGNYYVEFIKHLYDTHKPNDLICLCGDFHINYEAYTYGSINHMTNALDFHDQPVVCPWHFSQIPVADQAVILQDKTDEERAPYLATLNDEQRKALDEYMSSEVTLSTANGTISGKMPAGATAMMTSVDVNTALVNALVPASEFAEGTMTTKAYDIKLNDAAGNAWMPTEPVTVTVNGIVDESWEEPLVAVIHLLDSAEAIAKEQANGNLYTIDDAEILAAFPDELTAAREALLGDVVAYTVLTNVNNGVTVNANSSVTFQTNSFSDYYISAGLAQEGGQGINGTALTNGAEHTYYVEPGTTFNFVYQSGTTWWGPAYSGITSLSAVNGSEYFTIDGNKLIVSKDAPIVSTKYTYTATWGRNNTATLHFVVTGFSDVVDGTFNNTAYPVLLSLLYGTDDIPPEPAATQGTNYVAIHSGNPYTLGGNSRNFSSTAEGIINPDIKGELGYASDGSSVLGVNDATGVLTAKFINGIDWDAALLAVASHNDSTWNDYTAIDGTAVTASDPNSDAYYQNYKLIPYVVKLMTAQDAGWHIDCIIVPKDNVTISYDLNLKNYIVEDGTIGLPSGQNGPEGFSHKIGTITGNGINNNKVNATLNNSSYELEFLGWSTDPNATEADSAYGVGTTVEVVKDTVLYAVWKGTPNPGELVITKTVVTNGSVPVPESDEFAFLVSFSGAGALDYQITNANNETIREGEIISGGTVTLRHGEKVTIIKVPVGRFTVTEQLTLAQSAVYSCEIPTVVGNVETDSRATADFTNNYTKPTSNLSITKQIAEDSAALPANQSFTFEVSLPQGTYKYQIGTGSEQDLVIGTNGKGTITLAVGETATIKEIDIGSNYTITESLLDGYELTKVEGADNPNVAARTASGTITATDSNVVFTNAYRTGELTIEKKLANGTTAEDDQMFVFTVEGPEFDSPLTLTLAAGEKITLTDLKLGTYTVKEDTEWSGRYQPDSASKSAELSISNLQGELTFTNTKVNDKWLDANAVVTNVFNNVEAASEQETQK